MRVKSDAIGLALSWDGARVPSRSIPSAARNFLRAKNASPAPTAKMLGQIFAAKTIREIRICWVPRLIGGDDVLATPHVTPDQLRLNYRLTRSQMFGEILAATYCRKPAPKRR